MGSGAADPEHCAPGVDSQHNLAVWGRPWPPSSELLSRLCLVAPTSGQGAGPAPDVERSFLASLARPQTWASPLPAQTRPREPLARLWPIRGCTEGCLLRPMPHPSRGALGGSARGGTRQRLLDGCRDWRPQTDMGKRDCRVWRQLHLTPHPSTSTKGAWPQRAAP